MRPSYDLVMRTEMFPQMPDTDHYRGGKNIGSLTTENMLMTQFRRGILLTRIIDACKMR
jgi:hypothetical protein